jgi:hypothetical protein
MNGDRGELYSSSRNFYELGGNHVMFLTPEAALEVCRTAGAMNLIAVSVEGGIWHNPGFESRHDCILGTTAEAIRRLPNVFSMNELAAEFISEEAKLGHDVFILSLESVSRYSD